jgi:hypothetical protein
MVEADIRRAKQMSTNADEELYRTLIEVSQTAPITTVTNCIEVMSTVLNKRLQNLADAPPGEQIAHLTELGY